ncbi:tetratricopeptide repeat protein [Pseudoalteromonas sp. T1lg65]|uniref:tetratricopeptide repeat protein n=1 Tax=Pseudoalteromonas sp. T1lg65 TaxID=2077101 RepID=UPI003F7ADF7D
MYLQSVEKVQRTNDILIAPQTDDIVIIDFGHLSQQQYQSQYRIMQVIDVDDSHITLKEGAFTYRKLRDLRNDIRVSKLMIDNYFKAETFTLAKQQIPRFLNNETIVEAYRPVDIYVMGGIVKQRFPKQPKYAYKGTNISEMNQKALFYYHQGDLKAARDTFLMAAKSGSSWAQYNLATMFRDGEGGTQDLNAARYWFNKSSEQQNPKAKLALESLCKHHQQLCSL